tara:strand:- start:412 stop:579 length:168 start_codon:yes stop_codon:yes gene_type:complete
MEKKIIKWVAVIILCILVYIFVIAKSTSITVTTESKEYTDEDVMWITGEGDTIWE